MAEHVDHLKEFVRTEVDLYLDLGDTPPKEFEGWDREKLSVQLTDDTIGALRTMTYYTLRSSIFRLCEMIRFARANAKEKE